MEKIKFSIVTPCWNSELTIARTIESVLNQDYDNYEYIIIDAASTDETISIVNSYKEKFAQKNIDFTIVSEPDNGIYDAMNKGIKLATGDFVGIVNSDDYYEHTTLCNVNDFYKNTKFDICFGNLRIFDDKGSFIKKARLKNKFEKTHWNHPTMFVSKNIYNERLYACQNIFDDLDFMLWCINQNRFKIVTINTILSNFQLGGVSSEKSWKKSMERVKLSNQIYKNYNMSGYPITNFIIEAIKFLRG